MDKKWPNIYCLQEINFKYADIDRLKNKWMEKHIPCKH